VPSCRASTPRLVRALQPSTVFPSGAINISIDGVNTQDNNNRSATGTGGGCGFFSLISPRLDAVEEVTIATGAQGADSAGQGAVSDQVHDALGTNQYTGSAYFYDRDPRFNSNYWFNNRDRATGPVERQGAEGSGQGLSAGFRMAVRFRSRLSTMATTSVLLLQLRQFRQPGQVSRTRRS
jgi:hypothetical protein